MSETSNDYTQRRIKAKATAVRNAEEQMERINGQGYNGKPYKKLYGWITESLHEAIRKWGEEYVEFVLDDTYGSAKKEPHEYDFTLFKRAIGNELEAELRRRIPEVRNPIEKTPLFKARIKKKV